ncbi:MAG: MBOAT family O-acyltransferase, partial [Flavobacteriaceae bacterium]
MIFNSFEFIFFFPIVVVGYFLLSYKYRWLWLLLASYYFYMAHEPELVILLLISTVVDYYCGLRMGSVGARNKKWYLVLSIVVNIGILITFKYLAFFTASIEQLFNFFGITVSDKENYGSYTMDRIILPVGISFYTFQTLSYTIDVYRGKISPEKHFGKFALYVAFFPQLVAGPIERAGRLLPQLKAKLKPHVPSIKKGLIYMAWGFFLKVVVADRLGIYVDVAYSDPEQYHGLPLLIAALFFGCQIYYDFSAYTAIAIGAAKVFGINLIHNFDRPFFSTSAREFWNRWHISFMQWLRDYVYTPLGGSITKKILVIRNVIIVFFIVGLWHGANWTFVIWGLLNGALLMLEVVTEKKRKRWFRMLRLPSNV